MNQSVQFILDHLAQFLSIIIASSALINIAQFLRRKAEERKVNSESERNEVGSAREVVEMLRSEMERKDKQIEKLEVDRSDANAQISKLQTQNLELRIERDSYRIQLERYLDIHEKR